MEMRIYFGVEGRRCDRNRATSSAIPLTTIPPNSFYNTSYTPLIATGGAVT